MGKLVQFESRGKAGRGPDERRSTEAEILIFTGVRYERQPGASPTKPPASSSGGKRKRG